jgi:hypothetical protein
MKAQEMANCRDCGQARHVRVLNQDNVCPWCLLAYVLMTPNPYLKS